MLRWYGTIGILLIVLVELNFIFQIQPFANWYFPIIWLSYILVIDALVFRLQHSSMINNRKTQFFGMVIISALFWWVFEFTNLRMGNWAYTGTEDFGIYKQLFGTISFATVLPALFETTELIRSVHLFDHKKLKKKHCITKGLIHTLIGLGIACFIAPLIFPKFAFPFIWLSFFLILDPINYLHKQPSILMHLKDRKLAVPLSLLLAGIILGFLWEFFNNWAIPRWTYNIPYVGGYKIFQMPLLGYLGYFPFAFELYAMYWFVRSLFVHKEKILQ